MLKKKPAVKKKVVVAPKDKMELGQFVGQIREEEQKITVILNELWEELVILENKKRELENKAKLKAKPHEEKINELAKGVFIFATGHRDELTDQGARKTVELLASDKIRWYFKHPEVEIVNSEEAMEELKRKGLVEFIRVKEEINKELILQQPEKVKDLKQLAVSQIEIFAIVLPAVGIELQKGRGKFKKITITIA